MKKYIYSLALLAIALISTTACSPDFEGSAEGSDSSPKAALYQFAVTSSDGNYDADTDIRLRITGNNKTTQVYYKAYKDAERAAMTDAQLISDVKSSGTSVSSPGSGTDVYVTGMQGAWTIVAVATDGNTDTLTETSFYGITWTTVSEGVVRTRFANGNDDPNYGYIYDVQLQHNEDSPLQYRLKNPFGTGQNIPITFIASHDEYDAQGHIYEGEDDYFGIDVPFHYCSLPQTAVGLTYDGASLAVGDYVSVVGNDGYQYYVRIYEDYNITAYVRWTAGGSALANGWLYFYPYE